MNIQTIMAYLRLFRYKNLLITIMVQLMVYFCLVEGFLHIPPRSLLLLIGGTILIASAGYIINDIYDLKADIINRPDTVLLGQRIKIRTAMYIYVGFNLLALYFGFLLYWKFHMGVKFFLMFSAVSFILFLYAVKIKRTPLFGNFVVALLLAFVLIIVWIYKQGSHPELLLLYASFAFLTGIIRELLKDIEDMDGDKKAGFKTFPLKFGVQKSKNLVQNLTIVQIIALIIFSVLVYGLTAYWALMVYFFILVLIPLSLTLYLIPKAETKNDFEQLTRFIKFIVVTGTVSMFALLF
ncbi:MAG: geranylgeranylglycerol-phosphate geranylgeranyltransferase [Bacteroidetes bacterium]|jgi:4-hydroxybenzoate polyprenyltransferase|nr:geranylgeranylglycerol-phosphate geranylgeranyltransferase [Bacteroidota bacterium]MBT5529941.1 geranylgeranylglycerol-phosphate geranylgeranyltransferase [Cytophagia bacterium]MBT3422166.1 geranylgeranylglycerol-phosphate geranylgeranyltransferase [Bacteroidota bacterium]MBT3933408.1 geranylgeranylglycerol-phosphate geranylgeranyltransferase [Bacteroidota bacterium]MBT4337475.1 geranylgeranylglycerol-phosphate geranylgeranyltransferase [Bacteroidota bacterium]